jgi:hypothetical protein
MTAPEAAILPFCGGLKKAKLTPDQTAWISCVLSSLNPSASEFGGFNLLIVTHWTECMDTKCRAEAVYVEIAMCHEQILKKSAERK